MLNFEKGGKTRRKTEGIQKREQKGSKKGYCERHIIIQMLVQTWTSKVSVFQMQAAPVTQF
jgi:hypothetical protein